MSVGLTLQSTGTVSFDDGLPVRHGVSGPVLATVFGLTAVACVLVGAVNARPVARRFDLVACDHARKFCLVFDTITGGVGRVPTPKDPAVIVPAKGEEA